MIERFSIHISDDALHDLRRRLRSTRWAKALDDSSWLDGTSQSFARELVTYWADGFDWRAQENRLNRLPHFVDHVAGFDIHFIHLRGIGPEPLPIVLTHGWPGSFVEMERILPLLANPGAYGGDAMDAFDVVVPSLPGFGFSSQPLSRGCSSKTIASIWKELMNDLGYHRFAAQGGDIGAGVSTWLARMFPDEITGIHLNFIPGSFRPSLERGAPISDDEDAFLAKVAAWSMDEGAYSALQATKPSTLAIGMTDSPAGLAAWIVEKFRSWSDCGGEVENVFSRDELLTNIALYWFSNSLEGAFRIYKENRMSPLAFAPSEKIKPPVGVALFPRELPMPPRSWVERVCDVQRWTVMPRGGHFAAFEQPYALAEEIRSFFRPLRVRR